MQTTTSSGVANREVAQPPSFKERIGSTVYVVSVHFAQLGVEIDAYNTDSVRADKFIELVRKHTGFTEYSAVLLNEFVEKIIVHEAVKIDGVRTDSSYIMIIEAAAIFRSQLL